MNVGDVQGRSGAAVARTQERPRASAHMHRHVDAVDLVEMSFTPGDSLHSDDPAAEPAGD